MFAKIIFEKIIVKNKDENDQNFFNFVRGLYKGLYGI